ncbi:MAG: hypothetical protein V3V19_09385 [Cocleimonas sp.]
MKCFIKSLLGQNTYEQTNSEVCMPFPPIVKSLVGSVLFVALMTIASHMLRI